MKAHQRPLPRLWLKWLWFKHAYRFYFSHHPLCGRFRAHVIKFGQMHICRSCVCLYTGIIVGGLLGWQFTQALNLAMLLIGPVVVLMSFPAIYARFNRTVHDFLRLFTGIFASWSLTQLLTGQYWVGGGCLLLLLVAAMTYIPVRRKRSLTQCNGCEELTNEGICSGFEFQADNLRKYEQEATTYVLKVNGVEQE